MANAFTAHHSQLKLPEQQLRKLTETLNEQLTTYRNDFQNTKVILLKTLLDAQSSRINLIGANEPDMVDHELKRDGKERRKGD